MNGNNYSNRPSSPTDWNTVNWRWAFGTVKNLRQRIYRAMTESDLRRVRSLQKLMLRSYANHLVSVRKVTQQNTGARTPGVDHVLVKTPAARGKLVDLLRTGHKVKARPVRRIYIPKANGKERPLGIPTILDRAVQAVVKNALEPEWEARFEATSYGFRPGRSAQDAIQRIYLQTNSRCRKPWVVDADIKGCFDNIDHEFLLKLLGHFPAIREIREWLKAGYMEDGLRHSTDAGTPQGGVISPLLANIALHGLDKVLGVTYYRTTEGYLRSYSKRLWVRYADDFVVFCETREDAEKVVEVLIEWLAKRGLSLSKDKTRIVHLEEGFDFLGFNIRRYPSHSITKSGMVLLIKPNKEAAKSVKIKLKEIWSKAGHRPLEATILKLNAAIRGWANYFRSSVCAETFSGLDHWMFQKSYRFACKRHPNKGKRWIVTRYYTKRRGDKWIFRAPGTDRTLLKFSHTKVVRHVMVQGYSSPDDASLAEYWDKRQKFRQSTLSIKHRILASKQNWVCPVCGESLENGELLRIHYAKEERSDKPFPQILMHLYCHQQTASRIHSEAVYG